MLDHRQVWSNCWLCLFFPLYIVGVPVAEILLSDVNVVSFNKIASSISATSLFLNPSFSGSSNFDPVSSGFLFSIHISYLFFRLGLNRSFGGNFHDQRDIYLIFQTLFEYFIWKMTFFKHPHLTGLFQILLLIILIAMHCCVEREHHPSDPSQILNTVTSNGCNRSVVCGGSFIIVIFLTCQTYSSISHTRHVAIIN